MDVPIFPGPRKRSFGPPFGFIWSTIWPTIWPTIWLTIRLCSISGPFGPPFGSPFGPISPPLFWTSLWGRMRWAEIPARSSDHLALHVSEAFLGLFSNIWPRLRLSGRSGHFLVVSFADARKTAQMNNTN